MRKEEVKSKIDILNAKVGTYKKSVEFKRLIDFCRRFRTYSPYNAMLIEMQRPSAQFVLKAEHWKKKYKRKIKENARPMIILIPFGPVDFVFDISDTEPQEESLFNDYPEDIAEQLAHPYKTKGALNDQMYYTLLSNLSYYGIRQDTFRAGSHYNGQICLSPKNDLTINISTFWNEYISYKSYYTISINDNANKNECFSAICHELAHLFCHHMPSPNDWWTTRNLSNKEEEFEAETVSYLICERVGLDNPSEKYLSTYLDNNLTIPDISIEKVFQAVNEIEKMLEPMSYREGLLFKKDEDFRRLVRK